MAGVNDHEKEDAVNHWKEHYEGIILKLEGDKHELKTILDANNSKIEQLVYRYKSLENELQKASLALQRRGELDARVVELGLDRNLVKNMAEVWMKPTE
jgi:peptidoglycan hydrolase CwlO-like protein